MAAVEEKTTLDSGWFAARFNEVHFTGTQLTTTNPPCGPTLPWMESLVPGTSVLISLAAKHAFLISQCVFKLLLFYWFHSVLGTLVKNKVVPVPFYGLENKLFWILLILEEIIILSRSLQLYSKCSGNTFSKCFLDIAYWEKIYIPE
jgi:hypothetical protein